MTPAEALAQLGGCATWTELVGVVAEADLRRAVESGSVSRIRRGRYVLPSVTGHHLEAHRHSAVL